MNTSYIIPISALAVVGYMFANRVPPLVEGQPSLTFYYMTSCPHCKNLIFFRFSRGIFQVNPDF